MRKDNGRETAFAAIVIACLSAAAGGCAPEDGEPIPQAQSETDMIPDGDEAAGASAALASEENPPSESASAPAVGWRYDREKARKYIARYALDPNPNLAYCASWGKDGKTEADCTNFASQVLWQGGLPMQYGGGSQEGGWWYTKSCAWWGSSRSWRQVNQLLQYLTVVSRRGEFRKSARDLKIGDLIFYRVRHADDGYSCDGNLFNHTTVVSGFDDDGAPLVSYHSNEAYNVRWDKKTGSLGALGEACATAFVHIRD